MASESSCHPKLSGLLICISVYPSPYLYLLLKDSLFDLLVVRKPLLAHAIDVFITLLLFGINLWLTFDM